MESLSARAQPPVGLVPVWSGSVKRRAFMPTPLAHRNRCEPVPSFVRALAGRARERRRVATGHALASGRNGAKLRKTPKAQLARGR
jgi:hypothetical protein